MAGRLATGTLAARGARNPDALAAYITSRARSGRQVLGLAQGGGNQDDEGSVISCPRCGYTGRMSGGAGGTSDGGEKAALRTPAPSTGYVRNGAPLTVRSSGGGPGLANQLGGLELATPRYPVVSPNDILVSRSATGGAAIRHRRGGTLIGEIVNDNGWKAVYGGKPLQAHSHQRGALAELLGQWNTGTATMDRPAEMQLQGPPPVTPLMEKFGIQNIRAFATPSGGSSDGPRMTTSAASSDSSDDDSSGGLNAKGKSVFAKLKAKGWPDAKAMAFAKRSQNFGGGN